MVSSERWFSTKDNVKNQSYRTSHNWTFSLKTTVSSKTNQIIIPNFFIFRCLHQQHSPQRVEHQQDPSQPSSRESSHRVRPRRQRVQQLRNLPQPILNSCGCQSLCKFASGLARVSTCPSIPPGSSCCGRWLCTCSTPLPVGVSFGTESFIWRQGWSESCLSRLWICQPSRLNRSGRSIWNRKRSFWRRPAALSAKQNQFLFGSTGRAGEGVWEVSLSRSQDQRRPLRKNQPLWSKNSGLKLFLIEISFWLCKYIVCL